MIILTKTFQNKHVVAINLNSFSTLSQVNNILQASFAMIFLQKKFQINTVSRGKFRKTLSKEKSADKMLVKLIPCR